MMEIFAPYSHALASVALFSLVVMVLAVVSTRGRTPADQAECGKPKRNYANVWYRSERAFANAVENSGPFLGATFAAILTGGAPLVVNILASAVLVARIAMAVVHIRTENEALRSLTFMIGWVGTIGLALVALWGALF
jgi:uncharacterized MAPEG superfamily protein